MSWQVLDVFVLRVDDFSQLPATYFLLVYPHIDGSVEAAGRPHVVTDDPGDSGAPATAAGEVNRRVCVCVSRRVGQYVAHPQVNSQTHPQTG